jgi:glycolate oxidase FAD binding subunit
MRREEAIGYVRGLCARPAPLSGACHFDDRLYLRLSGNATGVESWAEKIGGADADGMNWADLRDHRLPFFAADAPLWRLSLPPAVPTLACETTGLLDWAGAQRWVYTDTPAAALRAQVAAHGGHATLFRHGDRTSDVFQPLDPVRARLHEGLKRTFDPNGIFNRGRLYPAW